MADADRPTDRGALLESLIRQRILVLDGAMGTMIQSYKLGEAEYRGERFKDHADEKARLMALIQDAGFTWVDFGELALAEADARGTPFAALGLYIDVVHHSPLGVDRLADALAAGNGPKIVER